MVAIVFLTPFYTEQLIREYKFWVLRDAGELVGVGADSLRRISLAQTRFFVVTLMSSLSPLNIL